MKGLVLLGAGLLLTLRIASGEPPLRADLLRADLAALRDRLERKYTVAVEEPWLTADLTKLRDPERGLAEAARLAGCDGESYTLAGYRLHRCPQLDGSADLFTLLAEQRYVSHFPSITEYAIENPRELFEKDGTASSAQPVFFEPCLARLKDTQVLVFESDGTEIRPFGGENFIDPGYVTDFNGDGVLERAGSTSHMLEEAGRDLVEVFQLQTFERNPRTLLEVIFNWHQRNAGEANEWSFTCFDVEGDGLIEIAFGPRTSLTGEEKGGFVFKWDTQAKQYSAGAIPAKSHVRMLKPGEKLGDIARAGGLGYPVVGEDERDNESDPPPAAPQQAFVYQLLNGATDDGMAGFFRGRTRLAIFDEPEDAVPNQLPEGFWEMDPKQAALSFVDANRTATHRAKWKLAIDDRGGIAPPKAGWLIHDWGSSGCYSYSSHLYALRFGVPEPVACSL